MDTIQINPTLWHEAEQLAKRHHTDLTHMVESFIRHYIEQMNKKEPKEQVTPFVESLGIDLQLPADFDEKEAYRKHLEEKYR